MAWKKSSPPGSRPPSTPAPLAPPVEPVQPAGEAVRRPGPTRIPPAAPPALPAAPAGQLVLPASFFFNGELSGTGDLVVEGRFEGRISLPDSEVRVSQGGRVRAEIAGRVVVVEGEVEGDVTAREQVLVAATGTVRGNLKAPRVASEDGARLKGKIEMEPGA